MIATTHYSNHIVDLIYKLKEDKENGWRFSLDSSLKIHKLMNYFYKVDYLRSELLDLVLDYDDYYKSISCPIYDFYGSLFSIENYPDIKIVMSKLNNILLGLQKIDLEEKRIENLFNLVFIINKCKCQYDTNSNVFVKKMQTCIEDIHTNVVNDFQEIMYFIEKQGRAIYKLQYDNADIVTLNKICSNSNIKISDRVVLQEILKKISRNGIFNELITISQKLAELKLQICNL